MGGSISALEFKAKDLRNNYFNVENYHNPGGGAIFGQRDALRSWVSQMAGERPRSGNFRTILTTS